MAVDKRIQYRDVVEGSPQERQLASDSYDAGRAKEAKAFLGNKAEDIIQQLRDGRLKTDDAFSDRPSMELASNERNDNYF